MTSSNPQMVRLIEETKPCRPAKKWGDATAESYGIPNMLALVGPNGPICGSDGEPFMIKAPYYRGAGVGRKRK